MCRCWWVSCGFLLWGLDCVWVRVGGFLWNSSWKKFVGVGDWGRGGVLNGRLCWIGGGIKLRWLFVMCWGVCLV